MAVVEGMVCLRGYHCRLSEQPILPFRAQSKSHWIVLLKLRKGRKAVKAEVEERREMVSSGTLSVLTLSAVMFIASFSAGTLPLAMSLSHNKMNLVTSLGIGLLVGTSLGVVLPEGIEMLYASDSLHAHIHNRYRRAEAGIPDAVHRIAPHESGHSNHLPMALALVSGYLVMHLLTFLPPLLLSKKSASSMPLTPLSSSPRLERVPSPNPALIDTPKSLSNTTIGLCIHALADGVALGSSAASNNLAIQGIVFFAIMLHKVKHYFEITNITGAGVFLTYRHTIT